MQGSKLIENLNQMLAQGRDSALLRYGLGIEYLKAGEPQTAAMHLREAVRQDPHYSAAWKMLGKALADAGADPEAAEAYREGIAAAEAKGDIQAAKEMRVFLARIGRAHPSG
ncbi:MAG: tetratricopeptide repeat protein [Acidiferrobacteraceae bacterium]